MCQRRKARREVSVIEGSARFTQGVIPSIDSRTAARDEPKLGSSLNWEAEVCEGEQDVDRQL